MQINSKLTLTYLRFNSSIQVLKKTKKKKNSFSQKLFLYGEQSDEKFRSV